ncbi:MAG: porin family protein [Mucinivorans sp.]
MKRTIIVLLALISISLTSQAQGFYGGVRAGLNLSSLTKTSGAKVVARANVGGFLGVQFATVAAIQLEALYSFQGAKLDIEGVRSDLQLDYLKIPIMAKVYLIKGFNVEAGVSFNILTSALMNGNATKGYQGFDFSIPVGLAYQFGRHIEVGVRYDISLVKYYPDHTGASSLWSINAAWRF